MIMMDFFFKEGRYLNMFVEKFILTRGPICPGGPGSPSRPGSPTFPLTPGNPRSPLLLKY